MEVSYGNTGNDVTYKITSDIDGTVTLSNASIKAGSLTTWSNANQSFEFGIVAGDGSALPDDTYNNISVTVTDKYGNTSDAVDTSDFATDVTAPTVSAWSVFESNGSDDTAVKVGDEITVQATFSEALDTTQKCKIEVQNHNQTNTEVVAKADMSQGSDTIWQMSYTVADGDPSGLIRATVDTGADDFGNTMTATVKLFSKNSMLVLAAAPTITITDADGDATTSGTIKDNADNATVAALYPTATVKNAFNEEITVQPVDNITNANRSAGGTYTLVWSGDTDTTAAATDAAGNVIPRKNLDFECH